MIRDVQCKKTQVICDVDHNTSRQDPGAWTKLAVSFPNQTSASRQRTFSYASTSGFGFHQQEQHSFSWMKLSLAGIHSSSKKGRALQKISRCSIHCTHLLLCWSLCKSHWFSTTSAEQNKTKPVTVFSFFLLSFNKRTITKLTDSQQSRASSSSVSGTKFSTLASRPSSFYLIGQLVHWFSKSLFFSVHPKVHIISSLGLWAFLYQLLVSTHCWFTSSSLCGLSLKGPCLAWRGHCLLHYFFLLPWCSSLYSVPGFICQMSSLPSSDVSLSMPSSRFWKISAFKMRGFTGIYLLSEK